MNRARLTTVALTLSMLAAAAHTARADVRADEKAKVEFAGMLGRMFNLFGGKGAREGVTSIVAMKGDRKATLNDTVGQIIDLGEEKIYDIDVKKKTYRVTTFAELRRQMEEAKKKAEEQAARRRRGEDRETVERREAAASGRGLRHQEHRRDEDVNGFETTSRS